MDPIFGLAMIVVVRSLFPKSFLHVIEASFFLPHYTAEYAVIVSEIAKAKHINN